MCHLKALQWAQEAKKLILAAFNEHKKQKKAQFVIYHILDLLNSFCGAVCEHACHAVSIVRCLDLLYVNSRKKCGCELISMLTV